MVKRHKKYRYDYEELKKKKEEEEASNISKAKSKRKSKIPEMEQKTEKSGNETDQQNSKSIILERDGFGPLGPQHKGKKNIRDFFNFNKYDIAILAYMK